MKKLLILLTSLVPVVASISAETSPLADGMYAELTTSKGTITLKLEYEKTPLTVCNFVGLAEGKLANKARPDQPYYDGLVFHRVIPNFMIQGGGFTEDMNQKTVRDPIKNEANNGLKNDNGTIAMARTGDPHSATAQFFLNVKDNDFLNFSSETPQGWGYAVFGKVTEGMDVVEKIKAAETTTKGPYQDVPVEAIIIEKVTIVE